MKTKVIIENGETTIILTPENEFEMDVIEKVHCKKENHSINCDIYAQYSYSSYSKHKIELSIKNLKK